MEGNLVNLRSETHFIEDLLKVEVVSADVKPQFVQNHFQLILKLPAVCSRDEETLKNWMSEDLVPGNTIFLIDLKTSFQEILCFRRNILPFDDQRHFFNVSH